ncbi:RraA family protein [Roseomonas harenae]|jgi:regulator of RNase E activity RraA|uniref:RraA family protein n=1 Tax=Muricoccus harenae TaxID=2692566 RepID=UPI00133117B6|nr:RraA family protein [Roseomonas harenae]
MDSFPRLDPAIVAAFRNLPSSAISDALDRQGIEGAVEGLRPMLAGARMAGQAVTLAYLPVGTRRGTMGDFLHLAAPGDVLALDMRGRTDCTAWGNILTEAAKRAGLSGTVIDGANRDIGESRALGYPIWSRAHFMRTGKDRWQLEATNVPIALGGIRVEAGDLICADDGGVVVVPREAAVPTLEIVQRIGAKEALIQDAVRGGAELAEARAAHGYFALQERERR